MKIKMLNVVPSGSTQSSVPDQTQTIIPTTINLTVTETASWDIIIKDAQGNLLEGITPTAGASISSYPSPMALSNILCTASDSNGKSTCTGDRREFTPGTVTVKMFIEDWDQNLNLTFSCPDAWSDLEAQYNLSDPLMSIDSVEELELLRCNKAHETYYIDEIDFRSTPLGSAPLGYVYHPIALESNVTLNFNGYLENLTLSDSAQYNSPPSLFTGPNGGSTITSLTLFNLYIRGLTYQSNLSSDFFGIIARNLQDPYISGLNVKNSTISFGTLATSLGSALFENITATTPGAASLSDIQIENVRLISDSENVNQLALLANKLNSVTTIGVIIHNSVIQAVDHQMTGLVCSHFGGASDPSNKLKNVTLFHNAIIPTDENTVGTIGGVAGRIPSGAAPKLTNLVIDELFILGNPNQVVGGVYGQVLGNLDATGGRLSNLKLHGLQIGGVIGGSSSFPSGTLTDYQVDMDLTDLPTDFENMSLSFTPALSLPSHISGKNQTLLSNDVFKLGGIFGQLELLNSSLAMSQIQVELNAYVASTGRAGGLGGYITNNSGSSSLTGGHLNLKTMFYGSSDMTTPYVVRFMNNGDSFSVAINDSVMRAIVTPGTPEINYFLNSDLDSVIATTSFNNVFISSPNETRDCPDGIDSLEFGFGAELRFCQPILSYANYNVIYTQNSSFSNATYSDDFMLDFTTIWNKADGQGSDIRLKP